MKDVFVVISRDDWNSLRSSSFTADGNENAGVLLCGTADTAQERRLLVRRIVSVPLESYIARETYHLEVAPAFYNRIVTECLRDHMTPVIFHSHPHHSDAWYSASDDFGETRLLNVLKSLLPQTSPASLVMTRSSATGRELHGDGFRTLTGIKIVGIRSMTKRFVGTSKKERQEISDRFDRQVRAFGEEGQRVLEELKIGIVGVGGIGSLVAEQLARSGIRDFALIDDDLVEASNVSRLFGSVASHTGRRKVEVVGEHLEALGAQKVQQVADSAIRQEILLKLRGRDLIFSCVDNDRTRALLNRFAYQYIVPVIDLGTRLDARTGRTTASAGRVSVVGPGMVCLRCSNHLNPERIRAESLPKHEREALYREGYIMGIDEPAPAVVSLNTVVAGLGATAGLNLFVGLTGADQPVEQIYDASTGSVFPVTPVHAESCDVCSEDKGGKGVGDLQIVSAYD